MAIQSLKKQNFRKCWHNREKLPNKYFLKISFAVSNNIPTFAVRWSGSLGKCRLSLQHIVIMQWSLLRPRFYLYALYAGGVLRKWSLPFPFCHSLSLVVFVLCFYFGIRIAHIVGICACALILVQLLH